MMNYFKLKIQVNAVKKKKVFRMFGHPRTTRIYFTSLEQINIDIDYTYVYNMRSVVFAVGRRTMRKKHARTCNVNALWCSVCSV